MEENMGENNFFLQKEAVANVLEALQTITQNYNKAVNDTQDITHLKMVVQSMMGDLNEAFKLLEPIRTIDRNIVK